MSMCAYEFEALFLNSLSFSYLKSLIGNEVNYVHFCPLCFGLISSFLHMFTKTSQVT